MKRSKLFIDESGQASLASDSTSPFILTGVIVDDEEIKTIALSLTLGEDVISEKWNVKNEDDKIQLNHLQKAKDLVRKYRILIINSQITKNNHQISVSDNEQKIMELLIENKELTQQRKRILEGQGNSDLI